MIRMSGVRVLLRHGSGRLRRDTAGDVGGERGDSFGAGLKRSTARASRPRLVFDAEVEWLAPPEWLEERLYKGHEGAQARVDVERELR